MQLTYRLCIVVVMDQKAGHNKVYSFKLLYLREAMYPTELDNSDHTEDSIMPVSPIEPNVDELVDAELHI